MPFKLDQFLNSLNANTGKSVQECLMQSRVEYNTLSKTQASRWIGDLVNDMVVEIGVDDAKVVMEACGQECIGKSVLNKAKLLRQDSIDIDEFLEKLNHAHIGGGKLWRDGNVIFASYERCYCGSVSNTRQPISTIYCQCSCGWYKKLFEATLEKPVKVEILDSIIHGADTCRFVIHI